MVYRNPDNFQKALGRIQKKSDFPKIRCPNLDPTQKGLNYKDTNKKDPPLIETATSRLNLRFATRSAAWRSAKPAPGARRPVACCLRALGPLSRTRVSLWFGECRLRVCGQRGPFPPPGCHYDLVSVGRSASVNDMTTVIIHDGCREFEPWLLGGSLVYRLVITNLDIGCF